MKKIKLILVSLLVLILAIGCRSEEKNAIKNEEPEISQAEEDARENKKIIYTSNYPVYDFTKKIAGDKIEVINLIQNGQSAHHWEPSAQDIKSISKADMFIYNGAGLENWVESLLDSDSIKGIVIEASKGVDLIEGHHHHDEDEDHDEHDEHDEHEEHEEGKVHYDPHTWLSLKNAKIMLENILNGILELDPQNEEYYRENYKSWAEKFDELDKKYAEELKDLSSRNIVVSHEAYGYLCRDYDLKQMGIEGINATGEPTAKRMEEIINFIKDNDVKIVFYENTINPKISDIIAKEANAETKMLSPLEALTEEQIKNGDDYLSIMNKNLEEIVDSLK